MFFRIRVVFLWGFAGKSDSNMKTKQSLMAHLLFDSQVDKTHSNATVHMFLILALSPPQVLVYCCFVVDLLCRCYVFKTMLLPFVLCDMSRTCWLRFAAFRHFDEGNLCWSSVVSFCVHTFSHIYYRIHTCCELFFSTF